MPQANIWIRKDNEVLWEASGKSEWVNDLLTKQISRPSPKIVTAHIKPADLNNVNLCKHGFPKNGWSCKHGCE